MKTMMSFTALDKCDNRLTVKNTMNEKENSTMETII